MNVTYGPSTGDLSGTETLQSCLESRLRVRLEGTGSTMFQTTLKHWVTKSGRRIFAQRARAVRISGAGFGSWPTPRSIDGEKGARTQSGVEAEVARKGHLDELPSVASLAAWATPTTRDHKDSTSDGTAPMNALLGRQAWLAGWATPNTPSGGPNAKSTETHLGGLDLDGQATLASWPAVPNAMDAAILLNLVPDLLSLMDSGATQVGFYADRSGVVVISVGGPLNPEHSRWLMGYPAELGCCGATAMQSIRTSQRGSSKRIAKREI